MATNPAKPRYSPSFRELYDAEREPPASSSDDFVGELQAMAMARPFPATLARLQAISEG